MRKQKRGKTRRRVTSVGQRWTRPCPWTADFVGSDTPPSDVDLATFAAWCREQLRAGVMTPQVFRLVSVMIIDLVCFIDSEQAEQQK